MLAVLSTVFASCILLYLVLPFNYRALLTTSVNKIRRFLGFKIKRAMEAPPPVCTEPMPMKMQEESPLFNLMPGEIRDRIFQYAVTEHVFRKEEFEKNSHYYRPGFRFADQKIDTALLTTCRRIYEETRHLPSRNHVQVEWCYRAPPNTNHSLSIFDEKRIDMKALRSLHLFTQQFWLEDWHRGDAKLVAERMPNLHYLKITLRHGDWWSWESSSSLRFDPKQSGTAHMHSQSEPNDPFHGGSWGRQMRRFAKLKLLELELESIEGKRTELDDIVRRAPGWHFPGAGNQVFVLNPQETKRTGRIGLKLRKPT